MKTLREILEQFYIKTCLDAFNPTLQGKGKEQCKKVTNHAISQIRELVPKKWTDYEQCTVGGHTEENCKKNIISKAKFEEHNQTIDEVLNKLV